MADPAYRTTTGHPQRRAAWARTIAAGDGIDCGCRGQCGRHDGPCPTTIRPGDTWHLAHGIAATHGGDGTDSTPWCVPCNTTEGARIGHARRFQAHSRDW